jgi:hypothetical protein
VAITTSSGDRYDSLENFIGGNPSEYVELNDNTPKVETTVPNIAGGLSTSPKPANDNDNRKPMRVSPGVDAIAHEIDYNELEENLRTNPQVDPSMDLLRKGIKLPKVGDISSVKPSENIVDRGSALYNSKELAYDAETARNRLKDYGKEERDTLGIGLEDWQHMIDMAVAKSEYRRRVKEETMKKNVIVPSKELTQ